MTDPNVLTADELEAIDWRRVSSRQIEAAAFLDEELSSRMGWGEVGNLVIRFKTAKNEPSVYRYRGATPATLENLLQADSAGRFLNLAIKGVLEHVKLTVLRDDE